MKTHISCSRRHPLVQHCIAGIVKTGNCSLTEEHLLSLPFPWRVGYRRDQGQVRGHYQSISGSHTEYITSVGVDVLYLHPYSCVFVAWMPSVLRDSQSYGDRGLEGEKKKRWDATKSLWNTEKREGQAQLYIANLFLFYFEFIPLFLRGNIPDFFFFPFFHSMWETLNPWLW